MPYTSTFGFRVNRFALLLLLTVFSFSFALAQAPTVNSTPENLSYETYGAAFTPLNAWVSNNGGADITPAAGCGPAVWTNNYDLQNFNNTCSFYSGSIAVTFTYSDACGNEINYTRTATLRDETPPSCVKPFDLTIACDDPNFDATIASYTSYWGPVTDLSHPITITSSYTEDGFDANGQQNITWVFTDACGNSRTWTAVLTVTGDCSCDVAACTMTANATPVELADGSASISATASGGNVPAGYTTIYVLTQGAGLVIQQVNADAPSFTVTEAGDYTIHCLVYDPTTLDLSIVTPGVTTGVDVFGLTQEGGGTICAALDVAGAPIVVTTPPTVLIVTPPTDLNIECSDDVPAPSLETSTTCPDGIVNVTSSDETTAGSCAGNSTIIRTYTATDNCGNSETATQTITITDTTAPVFTFVPEGGDVNCTAFPDGFGTPEVSDACSSVEITFEDTNNPYTCDADFPITRTWTATDECGNSSTASQTLVVWPDAAAPTFTFVPGPETITCPETPVFGTPVVEDNCTGFTMTEETTATGACPDGYTTTRTWTAVDGCGNAASFSQTITVLPEPASPTITVTPPTNYNLSCDDAVPADNGVVASTTCPDGEVNVSMSEEVTPMGCPGSFTLVRNYTITDNCGNSETASQTIVVEDNIAPVFSFVPASGDVDCTAYPDGFGTPDVGDTCGSVELTFEDDLAPYICDADFNITRTWTATDECGNVATASQTLIVWPDTEAPTFTFVPGNETIQCGADPVFGTPTIEDTCTGFTLTEEVTATGACPNGYSTTKTWTATDGCGNASVQSQTITVMPVPATVTLTFEEIPAAKSVICGTSEGFDNPAVISNCAMGYVVTMEDIKIAGECEGESSTTRIWTAIDECGNIANTEQELIMTDLVKPTFNIENQELTMTTMAYAIWSAPEVVATDNCSNVNLNETPVFTYNSTKIHSWVAIDACGNKAGVSIKVNLLDFDVPVPTSGDVSILQGFTVYPNPTSDAINLAFVSEDAGNSTIKIVDINGQTKVVESVETYKGRNSLRMNIKDLPRGNYFIQVNNGKEQISQRFVKL